MKKFSGCILLSAIVIKTFILTGCHDKTAQIEPNNWNCRQDDSSELAHRIEKLEHEGKIDDASEFIDHCQQDKLGIFSEDYENQSFSNNYETDHEKLFAKWKRKAAAQSGAY
ncbi:hypothetical protein [uncultured Succinivibrio sp.]|uniref:hypothetical protein n=1 Tax=uncultured Succinivibrio sp. TaxID=540749 RepID=UPI0025D95A29|nr:hypothetical protein [uncultured Succinivibrio sp.]